MHSLIHPIENIGTTHSLMHTIENVSITCIAHCILSRVYKQHCSYTLDTIASFDFE